MLVCSQSYKYRECEKNVILLTVTLFLNFSLIIDCFDVVMLGLKLLNAKDNC